MEHFDVIVVGAGPAGLSAAERLAENGHKVLCLDKKQEIGVPVRCAEGLGMGWFERLGIKPQKEWCPAEIYGAALYSPAGKKVEVRFDKLSGYVLERRIFEKWIAKNAAKKGAKIMVKSNVKSLERKGGKVIAKVDNMGSEKIYSASIIIAADGVESTTARRLGLNTTNRLVDIDSGFQYRMAGIDFEGHDLINLFFGKDVAPRGYCLTPESEVVSKNSVKTIAEVGEGDTVLTLEGWKSVEATSERFYEGAVFDVVPSMVNKKVGLTAKHEVFTWNKKMGFAWKKAEDLRRGLRGEHGKGDYLVFPLPKGSDRKTLDVSGYFKGIEKDGKIFPAGKNQFGAKFPYKHGIRKELKLTKEMLYLMGFFVAEGNTNSNGIILSNTKRKLISRLEKDGEKCFGFGGSIWVQERDKPCYQLHFSSVILKKMFAELFGVGSRNKKIPSFVFNLSEEKKIAFLKGYFDGDGGIERSSEGHDVMALATSSKHLANDLWLLLASLKIVAFVGKNKAKNSFKIKVRGKQLALLKEVCGKMNYGNKPNRGFKIVGNNICIGIREITKRDYTGKVYDIQTNGSFCVPFAVHNCWIFPKGKNEANVGIGIAGTETGLAKDYLDKFIAKHPGLKNGSIIDVNAGAVPVGGFLDSMVKDNLIVCGDAAHQVNPIHGGGIGIAIEGARLAADVASESLKKGDYSEKTLAPYNERWYAQRGNKLKDVLKRRHMLENMEDKDFEAVANAVTGEDVMKIAEGDLLESAKIVSTKLVKHPGLMKVMLKYLK